MGDAESEEKMTEERSDQEIPASPDGAISEPGQAPSIFQPVKTPLYQAINEARYQRQALIKQLQSVSDCQLICYVSGRLASIDRDDTLGFVDILHNSQAGKNLDVLIHSGGGDIDAAEKLISLVRATVGTGRLRFIVPDFAKSAATLMALGADRILMSDSSELGPIDSQYMMNDGHGNVFRHSVQSYLDAYEAHAEALRKDPSDPVARTMLGKLEPATIKLFEAIRERARTFAENQLRQAMFRTSGNVTDVARWLSNTKAWPSHGQMIGWRDAKAKGLVVDYIEPKNPEWQGYWRLYCLQKLAVRDREKLFESDYASVKLESPA